MNHWLIRNGELNLWPSTECRKPKQSQWPITASVNNTTTNENSKQIHVTGAKRGKTRATMSRLVLHLIGWVDGARFILNQSQSVVKQNQRISGLLSTLYSIGSFRNINIQLGNEDERTQTKEQACLLFIHLFYLCPLSLAIKLNFNFSKGP